MATPSPVALDNRTNGTTTHRSVVQPTGWRTAELLDRAAECEHVALVRDRGSGLRAIIAVYSTTLGPAVGGTRYLPYPDEATALRDVLDLARGMAYKAALAGLPFGGGKAVIIGDPATDKTPELLRSYGRAVQSLGGRYVTACDVGTVAEDMDVVATECEHVVGRSAARGGSGDSSVLTAYGVLQAMLAAATYRWGSADLSGRRVSVEGVGKVGHRLVGHLVDLGASVTVFDVDPAAVRRVRSRWPRVEVADDREALVRIQSDVFAPCALGGSLTRRTAATVRTEIVCGGANNQLAVPEVEEALAKRNILYTPDYVANAGGLIQVASELLGFDLAAARTRTEGIRDTALLVFRTARERGTLPGATADLMAEERLAAA